MRALLLWCKESAPLARFFVLVKHEVVAVLELKDRRMPDHKHPLMNNLRPRAAGTATRLFILVLPIKPRRSLAALQIGIVPTSFSTSTVSTITIASQGQPSRKQPSGPLLRHFLHPMQRIGSICMRPNGGWSSSATQNMQSSTGQYSTHAGEPAHPVQHSVMTASSFGFFFRGVARPLDLGSDLSSSGTIPTALVAPGAAGIDGIIAWFYRIVDLESCRSPLLARDCAPRSLIIERFDA
jgi:hypothetical protein